MNQIVSHIYQFKRGKESDLQRVNPFLRYGEPIAVYTTDGKMKLKLGDGVNNYNDLQFLGDEQKVVNYVSYFDFPNVGNRELIYKAEDTCRLYQWNTDAQKYEMLSLDTDDIEYICGGFVTDL